MWMCINSSQSQKNWFSIHQNELKQWTAVRITIFFQCTCFAPEVSLWLEEILHQHSAQVLIQVPPKESGVGTSGVCKWICWRERRRANPYLLPHPLNLADSLCGHFPLWCRQPPPPQSPGMMRVWGDDSCCAQVKDRLAGRGASWATDKQTGWMLSASEAITSNTEPGVLPQSPHQGVEIVGKTFFGPHLHPHLRLLW